MIKLPNIISPTAKMFESYSKQHDLILKSITSALTQYNKILSETTAPISETIQASIPNTLQALSNKLNEIQKHHQLILDSAFLHIEDFMPTYNSLIKNISHSLNSINYDECTDEEIELLTSSNVEINELKVDLNSSKRKTLTLEQWLGILAFIIGLITLIKDFLPDEEVQQLTAEVQIISNSFEDYAQKNLENQEKILEALEKNQCDCKNHD